MSSKESLIMTLAKAFENPDKEKAKKELEKFDIRTNTLYADGKRGYEEETIPEKTDLEEIAVEEAEFTEILNDRLRHRIVRSNNIYIGDVISIKETSKWQPTGRKVFKEILCVTRSDGDILKDGYSIIQW